MADEAEVVEGEVQDAPDFDEVLSDIAGLTQAQVNRMEIQGIESVEDMILIGQEDTLDIFDAGSSSLIDCYGEVQAQGIHGLGPVSRTTTWTWKHQFG